MATRIWNILCWNVGGINSDKKWDVVRDIIVESKCAIVCLQETKKQSFDLMFIKKICTPSLDAFEYIPSLGALGDPLSYGNLLFSLALRFFRITTVLL
jgi:hypothetical protein